MTEVRVIGAGLSGLATAWYLADAGARVRVLEAGPRPGGLIETRPSAHGIIETAARAFTASPRVDALFAALSVEPCPSLAESRRRYIYREGRLRRWPLSPVESLGAAARAASAWARRDMRPRTTETVAAWGRRVLGPAATTWLVAPALQGIYATSAETLSASAIFGTGRRSGGRLLAPRGGMGELIDRLLAGLRARGVEVVFNSPVSGLELSVPTVLCTGAPAAARLLAPHAPALSAAIGRIRMVSLVVVTAFFEPHDQDWRGFGVLFPRSSGINALGVLCNTDMFPGRGPGRSETWIYGDPDPAALPTHETALNVVLGDRQRLTNRSETPVAFDVTCHREALPIYDGAVVEAQGALVHLPPTWAIAGNYLGRLGVSKLIDGAAEGAQRVLGLPTSAAA